MITLLAIIFVCLLLFGIFAIICEMSVYVIPVLFVAWVLKRIDKMMDNKKEKDDSQK